MSRAVRAGLFPCVAPQRASAACSAGGQLLTTPRGSPLTGMIWRPSGFGVFGSGCGTEKRRTKQQKIYIAVKWDSIRIRCSTLICWFHWLNLLIVWWSVVLFYCINMMKNKKKRLKNTFLNVHIYFMFNVLVFFLISAVYTKSPILICILDPGNLKCTTFLVWIHICIDMKQPFTPNLM